MINNMRPSKHTKINILRAMILTKTHFFPPIWSTVALQCEDGGPWMHSVVQEANHNDHNGWTCIISDKNRQADNMQHETHMQYTDNN